jgi:hypothetical protein
MTKALPNAVTSYDLLKTFAVITMIIDHIGYYFFPEQLEWRVVGRMSMPVWMFLIGYAKTRDIPDVLWIGATILVVANIIVGMPILSLNILFGIILVRLTLDKVAQIMLSSNAFIFLGLVFMVLAFFPTNAIIEYGTFCYMFAIFGFVVRNNHFSENGLVIFIMTMALFYLLLQKIVMGMDQTELYVMGVLVTALIWFLQYFKSKEFTDFTQKAPPLISDTLKFMGRNTLEIYVIHLLAFKIIAFFVMPDGYGFLDFKLF